MESGIKTTIGKKPGQPECVRTRASRLEPGPNSAIVGNRGVFRGAKEEGVVGLRVPRGVRVASGDVQEESCNMTGLLVVGAILLLALGAAVDSSARLL